MVFPIEFYKALFCDHDLSLEPIITYMNTKVWKFLFSFYSFLSNNKVPLRFKRSLSLVETTLSILKMLLPLFIILDLIGDHVTIHSIHIHLTKIFLTFELIFILYLHLIFYD